MRTEYCHFSNNSFAFSVCDFRLMRPRRVKNISFAKRGIVYRSKNKGAVARKELPGDQDLCPLNNSFPNVTPLRKFLGPDNSGGIRRRRKRVCPFATFGRQLI